MSSERRRRVAESAMALIDNLEEYATNETLTTKGDDAKAAEVAADADTQREPRGPLPDGSGKLIVCAGGRGALDDAAVMMLAQLLKSNGAPRASAGSATAS